jgi:hypothetical protein
MCNTSVSTAEYRRIKSVIMSSEKDEDLGGRCNDIFRSIDLISAFAWRD